MSLNGSLQDFDLSYIFQIIAQEGKTGKLLLTSPDAEGYVIFRNGSIISAGTGQKNIRSMLLQYLLFVKKYNESELRELDLQNKNSLRNLANAFLQRQLATLDELNYLIQTGLEDITCSLFTWKNGAYSFSVLPNVDHFQITTIAIPSDAVTMEAARREDELKRLRESIQGYKVYIHSDLSTGMIGTGWSVKPEETIKKYLYALIDGTSSVDYICQNSFITEFRVFQELSELKDAEKITPLPDKLSKSINAALERKTEMRWSATSAIVLSSIVTGVLVVAFIAAAVFVHTHFFTVATAQRAKFRKEIATVIPIQKVRVAAMMYRATNGVSLLDISDLVRMGYISKRDLAPLRATIANQTSDQTLNLTTP